MKAEITPGSGDELVVTLTTGDIPGGDKITSASLQAVLPQAAGQFTEGILQLLAAPQEPGTPRRVSAVTVRIVRLEVVTVPLPDGAEAFA
jgi:hypothetical protein